MNLDPVPGGSRGEPELLYVNFNQDNTCICVGTTFGYQLIGLNSVETNLTILHDSFKENSSNKEETYLVERLFSSSLVAVVTQAQKRKLKLCHFKKATEICSYNYSDSILALKLNRQRLLVLLETSLYIHNIRDMKVLHTIRDTPRNKNGVCALSIDSEKNYIAYPSSSQTGEVQIFDAMNLKAISVIGAHDSVLAAMNFSQSGEKLATASEKGTLIRVFSVPDGTKLFEFQRGVARSVTINSLAFGYDDMFLAACSNTETVHLFKVAEQPSEPTTEDSSSSGWMSYVGKALMSSASYLPSNMSDVLTRSRHFSHAKLESASAKNICAVTQTTKDRVPLLLVITADGRLHVFSFDPKDHQKESKLLKCHNVLDLPPSDDVPDAGTTSQQPHHQGGLINQPLPTHPSDLPSGSNEPSSRDDDEPPNLYSTKT
ncbi:WD repeat domain phosphoinositide-interacting protein 2-like [Dysidea avara]|uniref:WD repeat domain phosphoinositide-interacting protein 2-like n=1 Tax=Dysidea avara TaxID=196820 RepID=UPI00332D585C